MKVKIENLGRIKFATVDLSKRLTLITGQNNSGKTWFSYLMVAVFEAIRKLIFLRVPPTDLATLNKNGTVNLDLVEGVSIHRANIKRVLEKETQRMLPEVFKAPRELFNDFKIDIELDFKRITDILFREEIQFSVKSGDNDTIRFKKASESPTLEISFVSINDEQTEKSEKIKDLGFIEFICNNIFNPHLANMLFEKIYFMPAERIAINIFSKEMSLKRNQLIDELQNHFLNKKVVATQAGVFINQKASRYPRPISEALRIAEDLAELKKKKSSFSSLADEIEGNILHGKISISKDGDFEFKPKARNSQKIGIHLTGSVVKTFASLVFYFRHLAQKNDFLVIDEPEINLHPDNQVVIAKIIAKIVNSGFKLMISTHSEYLIKEINYLICMKSNPEAFAALSEKYGYVKEMLLSPTDIGVFLFKETGSVSQICVDEKGFEISTIDEVICSQSEKALAIEGWLG